MIYTGIGSRKAPPEILKAMASLGKYMALEGFTLRSGGAKGADSAFEDGCDSVHGKKEIYLPYAFFNRNQSPLFGSHYGARRIAKLFHPNWDNIGDHGRDFMGRNTYQVLGVDLNKPTEFIVCWTPHGKIVGGTGQALRMADHYRIPVINLGSMDLTEAQDKILNLIP